jgi:hypothetical protein
MNGRPIDVTLALLPDSGSARPAAAPMLGTNLSPRLGETFLFLPLALALVANFFLFHFFFSYFRNSMISLAFTKVGHRFIRQMRFRHILSGGHDNTPFEAADARRPDHSNPPDAIAPFKAGQHQSKPAVSTGSVGATSTATAASRKWYAPPARQRTPPLAFASLSLYSSLFSLRADIPQLVAGAPHSCMPYFQMSKKCEIIHRPKLCCILCT